MRKLPDNPYGVTEPLSRMAVAMMFMGTGKFPDRIPAKWLDDFPPDKQAELREWLASEGVELT